MTAEAGGDICWDGGRCGIGGGASSSDASGVNCVGGGYVADLLVPGEDGPVFCWMILANAAAGVLSTGLASGLGYA